jgi:hypothetical protein
MNDKADPVLVWLTAVLMAAVTIVYLSRGSVDFEHYQHSVSPAAFLQASYNLGS